MGFQNNTINTSCYTQNCTQSNFLNRLGVTNAVISLCFVHVRVNSSCLPSFLLVLQAQDVSVIPFCKRIISRVSRQVVFSARAKLVKNLPLHPFVAYCPICSVSVSIPVCLHCLSILSCSLSLPLMMPFALLLLSVSPPYIACKKKIKTCSPH